MSRSKKIIAWMDRDLDHSFRPGQKPASMVIIFLPVPFAIAGESLSLPHRPIWAITLCIMALLAIFWTWRYIRAMRRFAAKSDRIYDIRTKHMLPPEYADTHSATKAAKLRALLRRNKDPK
ncbi:hypothetical protein GGR44_001133 [Sphingobium fontiphilum]|uniref:Uncharacterized protein n=1 Tax=Sphingobium fontiphilum TaxID=944425 RepID=A0A7W6DDX5_9SPHN|nr:hypothetical protein [Sphingobium fontiphilum]MBB3981486.1 hypothetical protein [Sphingobium fontiphilum]